MHTPTLKFVLLNVFLHVYSWMAGILKFSKVAGFVVLLVYFLCINTNWQHIFPLICLHLFNFTGISVFSLHLMSFIAFYAVFDAVLFSLKTLAIYLASYNLLITIGTDSCCLIIFGAIVISAIIKSTISSSYWPSTALIHKMPIKANKWSMLITFMLQEWWTLLHSELF